MNLLGRIFLNSRKHRRKDGDVKELTFLINYVEGVLEKAIKPHNVHCASCSDILGLTEFLVNINKITIDRVMQKKDYRGRDIEKKSTLTKTKKWKENFK